MLIYNGLPKILIKLKLTKAKRPECYKDQNHFYKNLCSLLVFCNLYNKMQINANLPMVIVDYKKMLNKNNTGT
ncbi:hypothetical protein ES23_10575 [Staphylococcus haemolyticus]|nr:hypothetical protein ES23_10575 [Staphylococcus haemolyticus]